jgi:hypothetical protein
LALNSTSTAPAAVRPALRRLQRRLLHQRWRSLGWVFQLELALLAALVLILVFWQARTSVASLAQRQGPLAAAAGVLVPLLAVAAAAAGFGGVSLARLASRSPLRTAWLQWPLPEAALRGHLVWEARVRAWAVGALGVGIVLAGLGYVPDALLVVVTVAYVAALETLLRLASALALSFPQRDLARRLAEPASTARPVPVENRRWHRVPALVAWWRKDLALARRGVGSDAAWLAALLAAASLAAWLVREEALRGIAALLLAAAAAAAWGEWILALAARDPFVTVRALPLGPAAAWGGRLLGVACGIVPLVALQVAAAAAAGPAGTWLFAGLLAAAGLGTGILAVNYGLTLLGHPEAGHRVYGLALAIALVGLLVFPPWGGLLMLAAAVLHSARRLPRWHRLEER